MMATVQDNPEAQHKGDWAMTQNQTPKRRGRPPGHQPATLEAAWKAATMRKANRFEREIAKVLGVTRGRVNQLLAIARDVGYLPKSATGRVTQS